MEPSNIPPKEPGKWVKTMFDWMEEPILALVIVALLTTMFFRVATVDSISMAPHYQEGDRILVSSTACHVRQGDVVLVVNVLPQPIIKRVIATEGQTVDFDYENKTVLVDGQPLDETRFGLENGVTEAPYTSFELLEFPQTVPEGCVFVLGDNRAVSEDSRYKTVGMIDKRNILGKVLFRVFPFHRMGLAR